MKWSKLKGLETLKSAGLKTPEFLVNSLPKNIDKSIWSVRLSSKPKCKKSRPDVWLPSIHNCSDRSRIVNFYAGYSDEYNIIIHETIIPLFAGVIVRERNSTVVDFYNNFSNRNDKPVLSINLERHVNKYNNCNVSSKSLFLLERSINQLKVDISAMHLSSFSIEFGVLKNELIYTDLTIIN